MEIVRGDGLEPQVVRYFRELLVELTLRLARIGGDALVLQLDVEIARFIERGELLRPFDGLIDLARIHAARDDTRDTSARSDHTFGILLEHLEGRARAIVEIVHMRFAHELHDVVIARIVLRQQNHMMKLLLALLLQGRIRGEVDLAAEDRFHPRARFRLHLVARIRKLRHARHNAMVGNGHRRHTQIGCALHHVVDLGGTVEQRVFRMVMKVDKSHKQHPSIVGAETGFSPQDRAKSNAEIEAFKDFHCAIFSRDLLGQNGRFRIEIMNGSRFEVEGKRFRISITPVRLYTRCCVFPGYKLDFATKYWFFRFTPNCAWSSMREVR